MEESGNFEQELQEALVQKAEWFKNALYSCFLHYYQETGDSVYSIKNAMLFASYKIGYMGTSNGFMTVEQLEQWRRLIWGEHAQVKIDN